MKLIQKFASKTFSIGAIFIAIAISGLCSTNAAATEDESLPKHSVDIQRSCYSLSYDCRTRNAVWVYEKLTADNLKGSTDRSNFPFKEDPAIPEIFRSTLKDYQRSGFDRGHLAPAADHKIGAADMADTFFLSNMSPQNPNFNRGYWVKLERHVRDLTKECTSIEVFTGPLYLPQTDENGKKWVKYQVIGPNDVAVPTHFFKIVALNKPSGSRSLEAYILPNESIDSKTPLDKFKATVQQVEKASGIIFNKSQ